ncbi:MAG TPA: hypothetical protein VFU23_08715 [Gemmatimonadales bacterium]|nr:hypothetical protein [Gemmatimonadales bacterium]
MRGCLSLPFRLLGLALLILAGYVAWSYRREIRHQIHEWTAEGPAPQPAGRGPAPDAREVLRRLDGLRAGADSVVLSAADLASVAVELAGRAVPGAVDSVEVRLDSDEIEVRARVDTHKVPVSLGPLSGVVRDHEYVEAGGRVVFRRPGLAEWDVERVRVRGLPLPKQFIDDQIRRFAPRINSSAIPIALPPSVTGLRVMRDGLTIYGRARPGGAP